MQYILETSSLAVVTTIDFAVILVTSAGRSWDLILAVEGEIDQQATKCPNERDRLLPHESFFGACSCSSVFFDAKASLVLVAARVE